MEKEIGGSVPTQKGIEIIKDTSGREIGIATSDASLDYAVPRPLHPTKPTTHEGGK